jgi:DNA-binding transcriptional MerR regulator
MELEESECQGKGRHYYTDGAPARLRKIEQLEHRGLSLEGVGGVIPLYLADQSGVRANQKVLAILGRHLAEADGKIGELQQFRAELQAHIQRFELRLGSRASKAVPRSTRSGCLARG